MKIDGWRQDPFGGGHFLFKYKLIVSGKLLLAKLTFGDMFAHFSACPWVFSFHSRPFYATDQGFNSPAFELG